MNPGLPVWQTSLKRNFTSPRHWLPAATVFMKSLPIKPRFSQNVRPGGFLTTRKLSIISAGYCHEIGFQIVFDHRPGPGDQKLHVCITVCQICQN
jgi:hypothetical protein